MYKTKILRKKRERVQNRQTRKRHTEGKEEEKTEGDPTASASRMLRLEACVTSTSHFKKEFV